MRLPRTAAAALAVTIALAVPAMAEEAYKPEITVDPLLETSETIVDQPFAYPEGTPTVTAAIVTIPPGTETGWHLHDTPLFAYVLEGTFTVDYGDKGTRTYHVGDSFIEAFKWPHNGTNPNPAPVRILTVYAGAEGVANSTPVKQ